MVKEVFDIFSENLKGMDTFLFSFVITYKLLVLTSALIIYDAYMKFQ